MSYPAIFFILGVLLSAYGLFMFVPALVALFYGDGDFVGFVESALVCIVVGVSLVVLNKGRGLNLTHRDGFLLTLLTWVGLSFFGALPFYASGTSQGFVNALFESVSGMTTTGATVFTGLDDMGHGVLFWRSMQQWLGGMGIVVLAIAVMPFLGVGGMQLYKSEMPGVTKDKLQPRLKQTALALWSIYFTLTVVWAWLYIIAGMEAFDAICHAMTTIATGGLSTHDASIAYYDSPLIETIAIAGMFIGGINFAFHYLVLSKRNFSMFKEDEEFKTWVMFIALGTAFVSFVLVRGQDMEIIEAFRKALFQVVSILTTTGYTTADYNLWPVAATITLLVMMFIGGMTGSTTGSMKMLRVILIIKQGARELYRLVHPHGVSHVKVGNKVVSAEVLHAIWSFASLFILCFVLVALGLTALGVDLVTSFAAAAATITNVGPGLAEVGPAANYAFLPDMGKLLLCVSMLLGRLEIFTLLIILTPAFWRQ